MDNPLSATNITAFITALQGHDPKKVLFFAFDKTDPGDGQNPAFESSAVKMMGGNPTVYYLNSAKEGVHDPGVIIRTVKEHVKKYGTLKELMIDGHGRTDHISKTANLDVRQFLRDVKQAEQELGIKIADRIEFGGCEVFADLSKEDVTFYKNAARDLKAEIVGAPSMVYAGDKQYGRFVEFTPEGTVKRDERFDDPIGYYHDRLANPKTEKDEDYRNNRAWVVREALDEEAKKRGNDADRTQVDTATRKPPGTPSSDVMSGQLNALPPSVHTNAHVDSNVTPSPTTPGLPLPRMASRLNYAAIQNAAPEIVGESKGAPLPDASSKADIKQWTSKDGSRNTVAHYKTHDASGKLIEVTSTSTVNVNGEARQTDSITHGRGIFKHTEQVSSVVTTKTNDGTLAVVSDQERNAKGQLAEQVKPDAGGSVLADSPKNSTKRPVAKAPSRNNPGMS